jgi:hypothetical protein
MCVGLIVGRMPPDFDCISQHPYLLFAPVTLASLLVTLSAYIIQSSKEGVHVTQSISFW